MNTPDQNVEQTAEHESLIKTPKQLITTIILAFIIPITVILLLIRLVTASLPLGVGSDAQSQEAVARRIQPVAGFSLVSAAAETGEKTGEQVYAATCAACHGTGVAGAPTVGDNGQWAPLIAKGYEDLLKNAIHGLNAMPPRGGNPALSDLEVGRAIVHMANQSGASFPEPEGGEAAAAEGSAAPAGTAAAEAAPAPAATAQAPTEAAPATDAAPAAATAAAPQAEAAPQEAAPAAGGDIDLAAGEALYKQICFSCHDMGIIGAPKFGDKAAWAPLIATGMDQMVKIAIEGKGAMPPRGGSNASDEQIRAAVQHMVNAAQ